MSNKKIRVFCPRTTQYTSKELIGWLPNTEHADKIEDCDLIIFQGGADVNPSLYNQLENTRTRPMGPNAELVDINAYRTGMINNIPMIGICRGAQLLTVMNGGRLIQDVENHGKDHKIKFNDGEVHLMTSTHHQMMNPFFDLKEGEDFEIIAQSEVPLSTYYMEENGIDVRLGLRTYSDKNDVIREPEIVFYPKTNCMCIQGHPEYTWANKETVSKINKIINEKMKIYESMLIA
jgi:gamma-glutamyl-gamma-aminobutyrate hydrolase PuuD